MKLTKYISDLFYGPRGAKNEQQVFQKNRRIYHRVKKARQYHVDLEMDILGRAADWAKDTENPSFEDLYSIYEQVLKDRHLKSQIEIAINDIQQSPFVVKIDNKEDDDLRELFDQEWYDDFIQYVAEAEFWGHSLIEFPPVDNSSHWNECFLIPRLNVDHPRGRIILDRDRNLYLPYQEELTRLNLVEVYGKEELGILEFAAEEVILKKYARTDWSQASERYGMPFLKYGTDTEDKKELDAIEEACREFAANGYIICGTDDVIEIVQPRVGDFYKIYLEAIEMGNKELSKLINGQTATGDAQAFVGTAEMHERIKNTFTKARLRRVQNHVNGKLLPMMVKNGYEFSEKLSRARIVFTDLENDDPQLITSQEDTTGQAGAENSQKKKLISKAATTFRTLPW